LQSLIGLHHEFITPQFEKITKSVIRQHIELKQVNL